VQVIAIILLSIGAAILYGVTHDQVTARICVEYFTIGHPPIFPTTSPTLLALGWGIIATWWVGLPLGIALALAARAGKRPKVGARSLIRPICILLLIMAFSALLSGLIGAALAERGSVWLQEPFFSLVPKSAHVRFIADGWAHAASYVVGFVGGLVLACRVWVGRAAAVAT